MPTTLRDVAKLAGVSPKTVSNVVNGYVHVRPETRDRVERAIATLNYRPNLSARSLRSPSRNWTFPTSPNSPATS
jgi:DNA-binding LacI/PurR family transcriptional regulator